jgi:DNA polymerase-3 subunit gamma/tau
VPVRKPGPGLKSERKLAQAVSDAGPAADRPAPAGAGVTGLGAVDRATWPDIVASLKLGGMARMLAQHCEYKSGADNRLVLAVAAEHRHLLEPAYRDKLANVLQERFPGVRVEFELGAEGDETLAVREAKDKDARQRGAVEAIDSDPFVRALVDNFDARLVDGSVRPV